MAWETRRAKRYYYTKCRRAGRVESHYMGSGEAAQLIAVLEALYREERIDRQEEWRREQESRRALDAEIDRLGAGIRLLVTAAFLAGGYHTHKGQWRLEHERQHRDDQETDRAEGAQTAP